MTASPDWLAIRRGQTPLVVSIPHTGTEIPAAFAHGLVSPWLARKDADWWIEELYDFARELDATIIRTTISRTVIDVNRDPSGISLYPGQATTEMCPTTTFDGEPLYLPDHAPDGDSIKERYHRFFSPYHTAIRSELARLQQTQRTVVLYDCHSIRSVIPRLFEGELPVFNIGTNSGAACATELARSIETLCDASPYSRVTNGRFKGGYITRRFGAPERGVHAVQMELACRCYMREPPGAVSEADWPTPYDPGFAAPIHAVLADILKTCLEFARNR